MDFHSISPDPTLVKTKSVLPDPVISNLTDPLTSKLNPAAAAVPILTPVVSILIFSTPARSNLKSVAKSIVLPTKISLNLKPEVPKS